MIFVNFKTYQQGTGSQALKLAGICQEVSQETSLPIIPLVQAVDIFCLTSAGFEVWAQHADDIEHGANTGRVLPEAILAAGAKGTLLNHSENKVSLEKIGLTLSRCRNLGLKTLVCAESVEEASKIAVFGPDYLAYEPPELIGSQTSSVSTAKQNIIKEFVDQIKEIPVLVGAGVHNAEDVKIALGLGVKGILVSSDVVLTADPKRELLELTGAFKMVRRQDDNE